MMTFNEAEIVLLFYLAAWNLAGFALMGIDKRLAITHRHRIPEKRLFAVATLGGAAGTIIGMLLFRHKTRHPSFQFGMPALLVCNIAVAALLVRFVLPRL